jgi:hypothetical protein
MLARNNCKAVLECQAVPKARSAPGAMYLWQGNKDTLCRIQCVPSRFEFYRSRRSEFDANIRPWPRTSCRNSQRGIIAAGPCSKRSPSSAAFSINLSDVSSQRSSHAPRRVPCGRKPYQIYSRGPERLGLARVRQKVLARRTMSGSTPQCSTAKKRPVRPLLV